MSTTETPPAGDKAPAPQGQQLAPRTPQAMVRGQLEAMREQFGMALPAHVSPEKFVRTVMTAVQANPGLLQADRTSLLGAAMKCAQDGLLPDGREAAFVPFNVTRKEKYLPEGAKTPIERKVSVVAVQYMPMIGGLLSKIRRSGELKSIAAHVVKAHDDFTYVLGDDERIEHSPSLEADRGPSIAVYAIAKTKDGGIYREVMSKAEVEYVRSISHAKDDGPWVTWWDEMARKTVLRRLSKRLPMSTDLAELFERDNALYDLNARPARAALDGPTPAEQLAAERTVEPQAFDIVDEDGVIVGEVVNRSDATGGESESGELDLKPQAEGLAGREGPQGDGGAGDDFPGDRKQKGSPQTGKAR